MLFDYFLSTSVLNELNNVNKAIIGLGSIAKPLVGDVLKVFFSKKGSSFFFEGLVFSLKGKKFVKPDTSFKVINKLKNYKIAFCFSFFYNLIFSIENMDHKKSKTTIKRSKISKKSIL
jgi:hypothetical protein